jgi:hypothetical protein
MNGYASRCMAVPIPLHSYSSLVDRPRGMTPVSAGQSCGRVLRLATSRTLGLRTGSKVHSVSP